MKKKATTRNAYSRVLRDRRHSCSISLTYRGRDHLEPSTRHWPIPPKPQMYELYGSALYCFGVRRMSFATPAVIKIAGHMYFSFFHHSMSSRELDADLGEVLTHSPTTVVPE